MKILPILLLVGGTLCAGEIPLPLPNGGFENGLDFWKLEGASESTATVAPEAAMLGAKGLRLQGEPARFSLTSAAVPVTPGKTYKLNFWSSSPKAMEQPQSNVDAKLVFRSADGKEIAAAPASIRKWPVAMVTNNFFAEEYTMAGAAPEGAASLEVKLSSSGKGAVGPVNFDDFSLAELDGIPEPTIAEGAGHPVPPFDPQLLKALEDEIKADPCRGKQPPKIVIKLDDFGAAGSGVHARWKKVADYAAAKGIKVTFGIIGTRIQSENIADFVAWTKQQHDSGLIEFWNHGFDHAERKDGNKRIMEFGGEPYEHQKQHMTDANTLAREKLGFPYVSFGAPFNATDENTAKVLAEDPDIKVWMYGDPRNPAGKKVLIRCGAVTLETPTIIPNYAAFIEGYAHNRGAEYFVLQGHPAGWGDDRWEQFTKIVEFLISQKAEFVFASDFAGKS